MSNYTLKAINKVTGLLATAVGGTGAAVAGDAIAAGATDTVTLTVSILTSLTSIFYGLFSLFKKK